MDLTTDTLPIVSLVFATREHAERVAETLNQIQDAVDSWIGYRVWNDSTPGNPQFVIVEYDEDNIARGRV